MVVASWLPVFERSLSAMLGIKARIFAPLVNVSLEDLVPHDHFYRHLEQSLDLTFVRELVQPLYAAGGRPSIDPLVFFKLQLVMFFEGIRSERQLLRVAADRPRDRKSTRLNSSHANISYAVFCLKKKKKKHTIKELNK